ncbi:MAG: outer membrane lipoprotein-sorting protein [Lentisphaerae bacterium]|nr:outer membrane lipoprotein-sorting protein [Lentisphaerota bacterium]
MNVLFKSPCAVCASLAELGQALWLFPVRICLLCLALLGSGLIPAVGATDLPAAEVKSPAFTQAAEVLARLRSSLPAQAIHFEGELLCGAPRGKLDRIAYLDGQLSLSQSPPTAAWTLRDRFGAPIEQLTIERQDNGAWQWNYAKGRELQSHPAPAPESFVAGSDLTWNDLSLAFLWWTNGVITGRERLLERECLVLEFAPPPAKHLTKVWIDAALLLLIKIEEYDLQQTLRRRLAVRTFKKVGDAWLVKDLDIRRFPDNHRTLIRLKELTALTEETGEN